MDDVLNLMKVYNVRGADGVTRKKTMSRTVYCQMENVSRAEFFDAGANGIRADYVFKINQAEYKGEELLEYRGEQYRIYRVYRLGENRTRRNSTNNSPDIMELYAEKRQGVGYGME